MYICNLYCLTLTMQRFEARGRHRERFRFRFGLKRRTAIVSIPWIIQKPKTLQVSCCSA